MKYLNTTLNKFLIYFIVLVLVGIGAAELGLSGWGLAVMYAVILIAIRFIFRASFWALRGNFFYITGRTEEARVLLKKALDKNVKSPRAYLNYAVLILRDDKDCDNALMYLERALKLRLKLIDEKNISLTIGTCHWLAGNIDKAIETIEAMRTKYDYLNPSALTTLGYLYILADNIEKAIEITNIALEDNPNYASAWDNLGQIYHKIGDNEKAKENFVKAIELKEGLADSQYFMGVIAENEGRADDAKEYFRKAALCDISHFNTVTKEQVKEKQSAGTMKLVT